MKTVLAFGASTSSTSINARLAKFAADELKASKEVEVIFIDLNDFEMPIFSVDRSKRGIPEPAVRFKELVRKSDLIVISFAEHNGSYSAAFKNIFDWASRIEKSMWLQKSMFLLATSPGARGARSVLEQAVNRFPYMDGQVIANYSLPKFYENFDQEAGITDPELRAGFQEQLALASAQL